MIQKNEAQVKTFYNIQKQQADAFAAAVLDGSEPFMTPDDSIGLAQVLDEMRRPVGVTW